MSYLGTNTPMIQLVRQDADGFMTIISEYTLPRPAWRKDNWIQETEESRNYRGKLLKRLTFYRFNPVLNFVNLSTSDFQNLVTIANWQEEIRYFPDSTKKWNEVVRIKRFEPYYTNQKIHYDSAEIEFEAVMRRNRIVTLDNYYILKTRTIVME